MPGRCVRCASQNYKNGGLSAEQRDSRFGAGRKTTPPISSARYFTTAAAQQQEPREQNSSFSRGGGGGSPTSHLVCQSSETEGEDLSPDVGIPLLDQRDSLYDRKKGRFRGLNEAAQGGGRASSASSAGRTDAKRRK